MSRAFGDLPCKRLGVTSTPELRQHQLDPADEVLVVASDGVWEYMTNEEVIALVGKAKDAEEAARELVSTAEERWRKKMYNYVDDITAVVVKVNKWEGN
jgi:serine/threonine protein phosphatase PrpC